MMTKIGVNQAEFWQSDAVWVAAAPGVEASGVGESAAGLNQGGCCLFQTSGSEGRPKWVLLRKAAMLASARAVCDHLAVTAADRWLLALPPWHVGGFSIWARAFVSGSAVDVVEQKWDPEQFAKTCAARGTTLVSLVPTQVVDLVQRGVHAPPSLRAVVVGGAGLEREMGQSARLLGWPVLQSYGMTETASQVATEPLDHLDLDYSPDALELLPHWTAALSDDGMLKLSGDALATGYIIPHEDGWQWQLIGGELVTRDKVSLWQAEGRRWLTFVGREAQMLKILGELVHLGDLQARLMKLARQMIPGAVVALGAKPEERRGHELVLYFQLGTVAPEAVDMLLKAYHAEVRGFERITRIDAVPGPLFNEMGKVLAQH